MIGCGLDDAADGHLQQYTLHIQISFEGAMQLLIWAQSLVVQGKKKNVVNQVVSER